jgi:hypothetical protein
MSLLIDDFDNKFYVVAYGQAVIIEEGTTSSPGRCSTITSPTAPADPARVIVKQYPDRLLTGS